MDILPVFKSTISSIRSLVDFLNADGVLRETDLFIIFLAVNVLFGLFLYLLIKYLIQLFQSNKNTQVSSTQDNLREDAEMLKNEAYEKALKILEDAKKKSIELIASSNIQAQEVLGEFEGFTDETKQNLLNNLKVLSDEHLTSLKGISQEMLQTYRKVIEEHLTTEIDTLSESFKNETMETKHKLDTQLEKDYQEARQELEQYRADVTQNIENSIFKILTKVTTEVLGNALSLTDQEQFIMKILDEECKRMKVPL